MPTPKNTVGTCPHCGKTFLGRRDQIFCNCKCYFAYYKVPMDIVICPYCNTNFRQTHDNRIYCSQKCYLKHKTQKGIKIGDMKWDWNRYKTRKLWMIATRPTFSRSIGWEPLHLKIIEDRIGRRLKGYERRNVIFLDEDKSNCDPKNLLFIPGQKLITCQMCGRSKVVKQFYSYSDCPQCKGALKRKLSNDLIEQILLLTKLKVNDGVLGRFFHVSATTIYSYQRGKRKGVSMAKKLDWKKILEQDNKNKSRDSGNLYDRMKILVLVMDKTTYQKDIVLEGKNPIKEMDGRLSNTGFRFEELRAMLRQFPSRKQWSGGDLSNMRLETLTVLGKQQANKSKQKGKVKQKQKVKKNYTTNKEYDELKDKFEKSVVEKEGEIRDWKAEATKYKELYEAKCKEVDRLEKIIDSLVEKTKYGQLEADESPSRKKKV